MSIENPRFPFPRVYWNYGPEPKLKPDNSGLDPGIQGSSEIVIFSAIYWMPGLGREAHMGPGMTMCAEKMKPDTRGSRPG